MTTLWIARFYWFCPVSALTTTVRNAIADAFATNGSLQTRADELAGMQNVPSVKLSATGSLPATALGWNAPVKPAMRDALRTLVTGIPSSRYYVVASVDNPEQGWVEGQVLADDSPNIAVGQVITWAQAVADIMVTTGLKVIPSPAGP